jgi:hypothetical protein
MCISVLQVACMFCIKVEIGVSLQVKWTIQPSQNPNLTSLHAGQVRFAVQHARYTALPTNRSRHTGIEASSPWPKDQVPDGLHTLVKKKNQYIRMTQRLQRRREPDHGVVGYPLFYA